MSDDSTNDNKVLLRLRDIRRAKGMSLNAFAEKIGIDYQRVGRMERGETQMTIDMLNKMSKVLHVPITELIRDDNIVNVESSIAQHALQNKSASLIPTIYEKLDAFCLNHEMGVDSTVKVYLATIMFNAVQEIRISSQDDENMVKVLFEVLDAIFQRLVLIKDN